MASRKIQPSLKILNATLIDIPIPINISYIWNIGSILRFCLFVQIISGLFLAIHYVATIDSAFVRVSHILRDVNFGEILRIFHGNLASFFFICLYLHIGRGIYYGSYIFKEVWLTGILMIFILISVAFLGYVLPWGQISFWGATVITNLIRAIPYLGKELVLWLWGGYSIEQATLSRFFVFHFMLPFILIVIVRVHIMFLHLGGSKIRLGKILRQEIIWFHPYFSIKDFYWGLYWVILFSFLIFYFPYLLGDTENFIEANSLITPIHIQPEWYFLFAYGILRAIPNKLGGVIALINSVLILTLFIFLKLKIRSSTFDIYGKIFYWVFLNIFLLLTWLGRNPVEIPYIFFGQLMTFCYFFVFFIFIFIKYLNSFILIE